MPTFRESLRTLKLAIRDAAREPVARFESETGLSPRRIEVELDALDLSTIGTVEVESHTVIRRVNVTLREVELD